MRLFFALIVWWSPRLLKWRFPSIFILRSILNICILAAFSGGRHLMCYCNYYKSDTLCVEPLRSFTTIPPYLDWGAGSSRLYGVTKIDQILSSLYNCDNVFTQICDRTTRYMLYSFIYYLFDQFIGPISFAKCTFLISLIFALIPRECCACRSSGGATLSRFKASY